MKHHFITCLTLLLTLCACSDPQEQPRDGIDLTGAWASSTPSHVPTASPHR